jgi:hypothetical protein
MFFDMDHEDFADEIFRKIEKDYGRGIARVPYFERSDEPYCFDIKIIFTDFKLLEGTIRVVPFYEFGATVQVEGIYY